MKIEIGSEGFLSGERKLAGDAIRNDYGYELETMMEINEYCHICLLSTIIEDDLREQVSSVLFIRALHHYQAVFLLLESGILVSASVALRSLIEVTFKLLSIVNSDANLVQIVREFDAGVLKKLNRIRHNAASYGQCIDFDAEIREKLRNLKKGPVPSVVEPYSVERWAEAANMHNVYLLQYVVTSEAAHSSVSSLERHLILNHDGDLIGFRYHPDGFDIALLSHTSCEMILNCLAAFCGVFRRDVSDRIEELKISLSKFKI